MYKISDMENPGIDYGIPALSYSTAQSEPTSQAASPEGSWRDFLAPAVFILSAQSLVKKIERGHS